MKNLRILFAFALCLFFGNRIMEQVTYNPSHGTTSHPATLSKILKVEITEYKTIIDIEMYLPYVLYIRNESHIVDANKSFFKQTPYKIKNCLGRQLDESYQVEPHSKHRVQLEFEKLPKGVEEIDINILGLTYQWNWNKVKINNPANNYAQNNNNSDNKRSQSYNSDDDNFGKKFVAGAIIGLAWALVQDMMNENIRHLLNKLSGLAQK